VKHVGDFLGRPSYFDLFFVQVKVKEIRDPLNVAALAKESLEKRKLKILILLNKSFNSKIDDNS